MIDLPAGAIRWIARARWKAEERLRAVIDQIRSADFRAYLSVWRGYARALLDAYAREALIVSGSAEELDEALRQEITRIVDDILPERSLRADEIPPSSTVQVVATGIYYEGPDDALRLAPGEAVRPHGEWERLSREEIQFALRSYDNRKLVREALTQALEGQAAYWADRFRQQESASGSATQPPEPPPEESRFAAAEPGAPIALAATPTPAQEHEIPPASDPNAAVVPEVVKRYPRRAAWLDKQLRIRGWTKHDLQRFGGPDRATTQKMLDGLPVREDVLERVARALSAQDPQVKVALPDIPRD
jgi:hypothetical protein